MNLKSAKRNVLQRTQVSDFVDMIWEQQIQRQSGPIHCSQIIST